MMFKHQVVKRRNSVAAEEAITTQDIQIQSHGTDKMDDEMKGVT